jgi:diguanylate cyclase (GGDEF)-like protein
VLSSLLSPQSVLSTKLPEQARRAFLDREAGELVQVEYEGLEVLGVVQPVPRLEWSIVTEKNYEDAYRALLSIRNVALVFTAWLLLIVGLIAYLLSLSIVGPLTRLSEAADKVSGGDLNIEIETDARGEIGALAATFNTMVTNLRWAQQELTAANLSLNERNKALAVLSATDALTGLHNRRYMMETLNAEVTRHQRYKRRFSVMMLDVDHFKPYNDKYGHPAGDALLKKVAGVVKSSLRANDFAARYGGEEFLVLLPDQDQPGAVEVAERIRLRIAAETEDQENQRQAVTVSIGIATFPEGGQEVEPLLANADAALYRAKNAGRNRVITVGA